MTHRKHTWSAIGRTLQKETAIGPTTGKYEKPIIIKEETRSVSMDSGHDPYGIAIDAPLAISLIKQLHKRLKKLSDKFMGYKIGEQVVFAKDELDTLKALLNRSSAITIDKNILLKTLSQPLCEGIRFYLCEKSVKDASDKNKNFLSLVTVGVDKRGQDLFYKYTKPNGVEITSIETQSLTGEYAHPPGAKTNLTKALSDDKYDFNTKFVLLKHALDGVSK
jgi:hypothetical protein